MSEDRATLIFRVNGLGLVHNEVISEEEAGEVYRKVERNMSGQRR